MPHAIIFGGSGFIGQHLARRLLRAGTDVTIADITPPSDPDLLPRYIHSDVRAPIDPMRVAGDGDTAIYLLAAVHRTPGHSAEEYFETNIGGARAVAAYAETIGARRLVFTSSIAVYGPKEEAMDEAATPFPASAYGWSKLMAERVLEDWRRAGDGRQLVISRPAVIFGAGEAGNFTRLAAALRRRLFAYPGRRDTIKGCAYVKDLLDSFDFALARGRPEFLYNFAYPEPYTIEAICDAFHRAGGLPRPLGVAPTGLLNALARPLEALDAIGLGLGVDRARIAKLTRSTHIAPRRLVEMGYVFPTDSLRRAERLAGRGGRVPVTARLIYILGAGRSGSTVLERLLASAPSVVGLGEAHALWRQPLEESDMQLRRARP